jgi:putative flippase GtrA
MRRAVSEAGAAIAAFWTRFRHADRFRLLRYAVAGVTVSIGYTLTVVLFVNVWHCLEPPQASAASFLLWTPLSYIAHRDFTFLFTGAEVPAIVKFVLAFVLRLAVSAYSVELAVQCGAPYLVGVAANWVLLPLISYLIMDLWVFRAVAPERSPR